MIRAILRKISDRLPCRIINDGERQYLERYYVGTLFGWRFYLHQFVGSDPDRGLHDHPWPRAFSIILAGWYFEQTRAGYRKVRWFNALTGDTFHRVVLPKRGPINMSISQYGLSGWRDDAPCWTLFFHRAANVKPWGFLKVVPDSDGVAIFEPYTYTREGSQKDWWLTAPKGRDLRRAVVEAACRVAEGMK